MTNPLLTRAEAERGRWPELHHRLLLMLAYSFVVFAMVLLLSDFCRLLFGTNLSEDLFVGRQEIHRGHVVPPRGS